MKKSAPCLHAHTLAASLLSIIHVQIIFSPLEGGASFRDVVPLLYFVAPSFVSSYELGNGHIWKWT